MKTNIGRTNPVSIQYISKVDVTGNKLLRNYSRIIRDPVNYTPCLVYVTTIDPSTGKQTEKVKLYNPLSNC